jgi:hypothetical protein
MAGYAFANPPYGLVVSVGGQVGRGGGASVTLAQRVVDCMHL